MKTPKIRNKIRIFRAYMNYTQKELADLLEVPITSISRWEIGTRIPSVYYAIGLSVATRRLVDELFSDYRRDWVDKIKQRSEALNQSKKVSEIIRGRKKINDNDKRKR